MVTITAGRIVLENGRDAWKVEVRMEVDRTVVMFGETLGQALQRLGRAVHAEESLPPEAKEAMELAREQQRVKYGRARFFGRSENGGWRDGQN